MSEPKDPAVLAAASPDPAVRGLAVRRQELAKEVGKIDSLLGLYGELVEAYQAEQKPPTATPSNDGAMSRESFVAAIRGILLTPGNRCARAKSTRRSRRSILITPAAARTPCASGSTS